jgi:hypothetical protein
VHVSQKADESEMSRGAGPPEVALLRQQGLAKHALIAIKPKALLLAFIRHAALLLVNENSSSH